MTQPLEKKSVTPILLLAILTLAAAARIYHLGYASLWIDEIASLQFSDGWLAGSVPPTDVLHRPGIDMTDPAAGKSLAKVWHAVDGDTHPPLYFILLRIWRDIAGPSDVAGRSFSVVCSLLSILLLYDVARLLHGESIALWAAAIMALATPQIVFAQEARGYAMVTMLILAMADAIARIEIFGPSMPRLIALAAATLTAAMTHYVAIPAAVALGLYALIRLRGPSRRRAVAAMFIAAAIFLLIWGKTAWNQRENFVTHLAWLGDDQPGLALRTLDRLASLPLQFFITPKQHDASSAISRIAAVLYFIPLLAIRRRGVLLWVLLAAAIIASTATADLIQHRKALETLRYTIPAAPAAYALVPAVAACLPRKWMWHLVPALFVVSCLAAIPEAYNQYWKANYRAFASAFDRAAGPDDLVLIIYESPEKNWEQSLLYAAMTHYSLHPHRPLLVLSRPVSPAQIQDLKSSPGLWLLSGSETPPIGRFIPGTKIMSIGETPFVGAYMELEFR